jgi:hypothetical protein
MTVRYFIKFFLIAICLILGHSAVCIYQLDLHPSEYSHDLPGYIIYAYATYLVKIFNTPPTAYFNLANIFLGFSVLFGYISFQINTSSEYDASLYYPGKYSE